MHKLKKLRFLGKCSAIIAELAEKKRDEINKTKKTC